MGLVINHNMMAAGAARNLNSAYNDLNKSVSRLSSGLRINSASDDAAGLAIREMMRSDVATLNQGVRNANDAISMLQTADGALGVIDEKLIRMKELAEQASTGSYTSTQRLIIDSEYQAMASEITRIANATDFNGIKLLNGNLSAPAHDGSGETSSGAMKVHFGTGNDSAEDYYYIRLQSATAAALGIGNSTNFNTSMDRVANIFASALNGEFGSMASGTTEEKKAFEALQGAVNDVIAQSRSTSDKIFDESKSLDDQFAAYNALFDRAKNHAGSGTATGADAADGIRVYNSVEDLQQAAFEYYRAEADAALGTNGGFATAADHEKALNNVAKMFDNAIILPEGSAPLKQMSKDEFKALSSTDRDALKTTLAMGKLNTIMNGTRAQQSNTDTAVVGNNYSNYDRMAGAAQGTAATTTSYSEEEVKKFISKLDYGYEAGKTLTQAINGLDDVAVGKFNQGTNGSSEFPAGTILRTTGVLQSNTKLQGVSASAPGASNSITEGTTLAEGSVLKGTSTLGAGTQIGAGTTLGGTITSSGDILGKGTVFGAGSRIATATALGEGTTLNNGTHLTAGTLGTGTQLGSGTRVNAGGDINLTAGTTLGGGTILAAGSELGIGSVLGAGTKLGNGAVLDEGSVLGNGTVLKGGNGFAGGDMTLGIGTEISLGSYVLAAGETATIGGVSITGTGNAADTLSALYNNTSGNPTFVDGTTVATLTSASTSGQAVTFAGGGGNGYIKLGGNSAVAAGKTFTVNDAAGLELSGSTTVRGAVLTVTAGTTFGNGTTIGGTSKLVAGTSVLNGTTLGTGGMIIGAGDTVDATDGTELHGTTTGIVGTLGEGSTLGAALTTLANTDLGSGTKFGSGSVVGAAGMTLTGDTVTGGTTTLRGNSTLATNSTLAAGSELAVGSAVPTGADPALNGSMFTGTDRDPTMNGVYGKLAFNAATGSIERQGNPPLGSLQSAAEAMLKAAGTKASQTVSMDGNNIRTQENAQRALAALDKAIETKDNMRADIGALQNRLENTITNLTTQSENVQASESRISDVDVATEMTSFTRNQVLTQTAISMLAQANSMGQLAQKLIG